MTTIYNLFEKYSEKELKNILNDKNTIYFFNEGNKYIVQKIKKIHGENVYFVKEIYNEYSEHVIMNQEDFSRLIKLTFGAYKELTQNSDIYDRLDMDAIFFNAACKHYGIDNVDRTSEGWYRIHIPHILLKSENGLEHNIHEVYIDLQMTDEAIIPKRFFRTSISSSELRSNYLFSHVSGDAYRGIATSFCTGGSETPMSKMRNRNISTPKEMYETIPYYFHILDAYLSWESISGAPYVRISSVKDNNNLFTYTYRQTSAYTLYYYAKYYYNRVIRDIQNLEFEYTGVYDIKLSDKVKKDISDLMDTYPLIVKNEGIVRNGNHCIINKNYTHQTLSEKYAGRSVLTFKGQTKTLTVLNDDPTFDNKLEKPNDILKGFVIKYIEDKIKISLWKQRDL